MDHRLGNAYSFKLSLRIALVGCATEALLSTVRDCGCLADCIASIPELYHHILANQVDVVVLDDNLPDQSGFDVARHLRVTFDAGIVMLVCSQHDQDALQALRSGADFYLPKPVDPHLLAALLQSFSRWLTRPSPATIARQARVTCWRLGDDDWRLVSPHDHVVALTVPERGIVQRLVRERGQAVPRDALIAAVAHDVYEFDPHRLEMIIHRLRRKVLGQTGEPLPLHTVRGKGYLLTDVRDSR